MKKVNIKKRAPDRPVLSANQEEFTDRICCWPEWNDQDIALEKWNAKFTFEDVDQCLQYIPRSLRQTFESLKRPVELDNLVLITPEPNLDLPELGVLVRKLQQHVALCKNKDVDFYPWDLIYPKAKDGQPMYNPAGRYCIKLFWLGAWRKVFIDDKIPVDQDGHPILPYHQEIWPLLLTKALLKISAPSFDDRVDKPEFGDFDFLHALTGSEKDLKQYKFTKTFSSTFLQVSEKSEEIPKQSPLFYSEKPQEVLVMFACHSRTWKRKPCLLLEEFDEKKAPGTRNCRGRIQTNASVFYSLQMDQTRIQCFVDAPMNYCVTIYSKEEIMEEKREFQKEHEDVVLGNGWSILCKHTLKSQIFVVIEVLLSESIQDSCNLQIIDNDDFKAQIIAGNYFATELKQNLNGYTVLLETCSQNKGRYKIRFIGSGTFVPELKFHTLELEEQAKTNVLFRNLIKPMDCSASMCLMYGGPQHLITIQVFENDAVLYESSSKEMVVVPHISLNKAKRYIVQGSYKIPFQTLELQEQQKSYFRRQRRRTETCLLKVMSSDAIVIVKDTEKEDRHKRIKEKWESKQPGRASKAREIRENFLKTNVVQSIQQFPGTVLTNNDYEQRRQSNLGMLNMFGEYMATIKAQWARDKKRSEESRFNLLESLDTVSKYVKQDRELDSLKKQEIRDILLRWVEQEAFKLGSVIVQRELEVEVVVVQEPPKDKRRKK